MAPCAYNAVARSVMATPTLVQIQNIHIVYSHHVHLGRWTGRVACDMKEAAHAGSNDIVAPSLRIGTTLAETFARQLGQTRESYFTCYGAIDETGVEGGQRLITEA